jgi:hypothetical protein
VKTLVELETWWNPTGRSAGGIGDAGGIPLVERWWNSTGETTGGIGDVVETLVEALVELEMWWKHCWNPIGGSTGGIPLVESLVETLQESHWWKRWWDSTGGSAGGIPLVEALVGFHWWMCWWDSTQAWRQPITVSIIPTVYRPNHCGDCGEIHSVDTPVEMLGEVSLVEMLVEAHW